MNGKERITTMVDVFKKQKEEFTEKMKVEFNSFFKEFFAEHPEIKKVVWTQYTPYFNDGETCEFSTNFYDLFDNDRWEDYDDDDDDDDDDEEEENHSEELTEEQQTILDAVGADLQELLESIPDEVYKDMFGDHCKVVATSDGFDVQEYDHE